MEAFQEMLQCHFFKVTSRDFLTLKGPDQAPSNLLGIMPRLHLTVLTTRNET